MKNRRLWEILALFTIVAVALVQCDQFILYDELVDENLESQVAQSPATQTAALAIAPVAATLTATASLTFSASGGTPPYVYSMTSGLGTIDADTGVYSAPLGASTDAVRVTDAAGGTNDAAVTVTTAGALGISPSSISLVTNGSITFAAGGGTAPYTFSVESGGGVIDAVSGAYVAPPTSGLATVRVTDSQGTPETAEASITVNIAGALLISPSSIVLGTGGSVSFNAYGGVAPYAFSIVVGGGSVDPVTGVYNAPLGSDSVTVRVTDSDTPPSTNDAAVTVNAPPPAALAISPSSISLFTNSTAGFGAGGGVPPYSFLVVAGAGSVNPTTGVFTASSTAGTSTIRVTDSDAPPAQIEAIATVYEPLRIVPESRSLTVGSSFSFSATGGKTPYNYTVVSGGGSMNAATGLYTAPGGAGSAVVRVTDDLMNTRDAAVTVTAAQPLVITPASKTLIAGDSVSFTAIGGTSPYTFSILAPADGFINATTGEYTAPGSTATDIIRVTDALNNTSDATATVVGAGPLSISPGSVTVPVNGQRVFSASGGAPPYSFAVVSGAGSINASTGTYSAPPSAGAVTVRVTDSLLNNQSATVDVAGAGCGLSFTENEPNDDDSPPWTNVDDFGIELVPGCSVTIFGETDLSGEADVFAFSRGSANVVTFIATWNTGDDELDFQLYDNGGNDVVDSDSDGADIEFMMWTVGGGSPMRYLAIETAGDGGASYTLTISAE